MNHARGSQLTLLNKHSDEGYEMLTHEEETHHVGSAEETQETLVVAGTSQLLLVVHNVVPLLSEEVKVVLASVGTRAVEVLGTTAQKDIRAVPLGPGVVLYAAVVLVDDLSVPRPETGVAG